MTIWIVGGTSESRQVARQLSSANYPWVATVVTPEAQRLYITLNGRVSAGALTADTLPKFLSNEDICGIVDASHPFATEISHLAIAGAQAHALPYLRYERPRLAMAPATLRLPAIECLLQPQYLQGRRILLAIGVQSLAQLAPWQACSQLWARIWPSERSRDRAIAAGFAAERLILQKPPRSVEDERRLWRSLQLDAVVTKASGQASGFDLKQAAAAQLGIQLIAIERPAIAYPQQTTSLECVLTFCCHCLS